MHSLPTFCLPVTAKSNYQIRQSDFDESLSTLEASTLALSIIEPELSTTALLKSFEKMIGFQIEKMGEDIFKKNYGR